MSFDISHLSFSLASVLPVLEEHIALEQMKNDKCQMTNDQ